MKKLLYSLIVGSLLPLGLIAQGDSVLYGLNVSGLSLRMASADVTTGQVSIINNTPTSGAQFASGISDLDAAGGRYFYIESNQVYTVDVQTGSVLSSPTITCATQAISPYMPVVNIAWNPMDSKLYCLHFLDNELRFGILDPGTGVLTILTPNPISGSMFGSGVSDLDPIGRRYFYVRGNNLLTVNLNNGNVISNVQIENVNGATMPITNIAYNWVTNQIFGLNYKEEVLDGQGFPIAPAELRLATVNPISGKVRLVSKAPISEAQFESGVSDIHIAGNFFTYVRGGVFNRRVVSVDLSTGEVVWQPALSNTSSSVSPLTNIAYAKNLSVMSTLPVSDFDYDSLGLGVFRFRDLSRYAVNVSWDFGDGQGSSIRYPVHTYTASGQYTVRLVVENIAGSDTLYRTVTVGSLVAMDTKVDVDWTVYPNPASEAIRLRSSSTTSMEDVQVTLVNVQGKTIADKLIPALQAGSEAMLEIPGNTANGVYFLRVRSENETRNFRIMIAK